MNNFTFEELNDLSRALLFLNVAIRQDVNHNIGELGRIQALYEKVVDMIYSHNDFESCECQEQK